MKNALKVHLGLALIVLLPSCNSGASDSVKNAKDSNAAKIDSQRTIERPAAAMVMLPPKADADFLVDAANGSMMEVQLGRLVQRHAYSDRVKDYGEMMIKEHGEGNTRIKTLAAAKNVTLPSTFSSRDKKEIEGLRKKTGLAFDRAYIKMTVKGHKDDIKEFEKEAAKGTDREIVAFANSNLAILRKHLESAEHLQKLFGVK